MKSQGNIKGERAKQSWQLAVALIALASGFGGAVLGQDADSQAAITYVPGRPWTMIIPDPDTFDWTSQNRPGYRFRGMLPVHERFYEFIQQRRASGVELRWGEQMMIRRLQAIRRWPAAPVPSQPALEYLRYLRNQTTRDLNLAQSLMLAELINAGVYPVDPAPDANVDKMVQYLNSGPFEPRNWFERMFGRVEPWMNQQYASWGKNMQIPAGPGGNTYTPEPFNGMQITYNLSGVKLLAAEDQSGFTCTRTQDGEIAGDQIQLSGTSKMGGGFGADLSVRLWAGSEEKTYTNYIKSGFPGFNSVSYNLTVPVPKSTETGGFRIQMDGRYSMGGGHRGLVAHGKFGLTAEEKARKDAEARAKWQKEVEETLKELGYEDTPVGKELKDMREALKGSDSDWKNYVDKKQKELGYDDAPEAPQFRELRDAMNTGGADWDAYVKSHSTPPTDNTGQQVVPPGDSGVSQAPPQATGGSASPGQPGSVPAGQPGDKSVAYQPAGDSTVSSGQPGSKPAEPQDKPSISDSTPKDKPGKDAGISDVPGPDFGSPITLQLQGPRTVKPGDIVAVKVIGKFDTLMKSAWIGLFEEAEEGDNYLKYTFINNLTGGIYDIEAPDKPGRYNFRAFLDKGAVPVAVSDAVEVKAHP